MIFILAKYKLSPFVENAKTIAIGISQAKVLSWSIKIFFTAGSSSHAVADVLPATNMDKTKDRIILFKCFLTYS